MTTKEQRAKDNLHIFTGSRGRQHFENGNRTGRPIETTTTTDFFEADMEHPDQVCQNLGVGEDGTRTPYEDLRPAVKPKITTVTKS